MTAHSNWPWVEPSPTGAGWAMVFIATLRIELSSITTRRLNESTVRMAQRRRCTTSETPFRRAGGTGGVDAAGVEDSVGVGGDATGGLQCWSVVLRSRGPGRGPRTVGGGAWSC
ncbi:hypothetical protein ACFQ51_12600 [Streptomyces kaempferi]